MHPDEMKNPGVLDELARRKNRCVFPECGLVIDVPHQFCKTHVQDVPFYMRNAITGDGEWLAKHGELMGDVHFRSLVNVAVTRAAQDRAIRDPEFAKRMEERAKDLEMRNKAKAAGLVLPASPT